MNRKIYKTTLAFLLCLSAVGCKKDKVSCADDITFCSYVKDDNLVATGPLIDEFLKGLKGKDEKKLEMLVSWLECHSCVVRASVFCNSCVKTSPVQSELSIDFFSNGKLDNKIMDVSMSDPMKFYRYHD